jgi:hypothetical protein
MNSSVAITRANPSRRNICLPVMIGLDHGALPAAACLPQINQSGGGQPKSTSPSLARFPFPNPLDSSVNYQIPQSRITNLSITNYSICYNFSRIPGQRTSQ